MPPRTLTFIRALSLFVIFCLVFQSEVKSQTSSDPNVRLNSDNKAFIVVEPKASVSKGKSLDSAMDSAPDAETKPPKVLTKAEKNNAKAKAARFLVRHQSKFGIKNMSSLRLKEVRRGVQNTNRALFQQEHNGIPILGSIIATSSNSDAADDVYLATGRYADVSNLGLITVPKVTAKQAQDVAINYILTRFKLPELKKTFSDPKQIASLYAMFPAKLYYVNESLLRGRFENTADQYRLSYLVEANTGFDISGIVEVDATTGAVVSYVDAKQMQAGTPPPLPPNIIHDCTGGCSCSVARSGTGPAVGANPVYGGRDVDSVFGMFDGLRSYYNSEFGLFGANGVGGIGDGLVTKFHESRAYTYYNACSPNTCQFGNAFFSYSPRAITFCAGSPSLDVMGHEYLHAMVASYSVISPNRTSAAFFNQYESGAIHEAVADAFGEDFASYTDVTSFDWIAGTGSNIQEKRSMRQPSSYYYRVTATGYVYPYPDRYTSNSFYCGAEDSGGVHRNSTVVSKAFHLASVGTAGQGLPGDKFNGCQITGIGLFKVTQILFHTIMNGTTYISNFNEFYNAVDVGCNLLTNSTFNKYGVTAADCTQMRKAMQAVELNFPPGTACKPDKYVPTCAQPIPGDCNFDGLVNEGDRNVWVTNYGKSAPPLMKLACDLNNDGFVDPADHALWREAYGYKLPPMVTAVGTGTPYPH